jgi:hypothetical protein
MTEEIFLKNLSLIDESLDKNDTSKYNLNIELSLNELAYCIYDSERNKFIALENYKIKEVYNPYKLSEAIEEIFLENKWLSGNFKETRIVYINNKSTLVPVPLYDAKEEEIYFNFNHEQDDGEDVYCDKMINLNAYNLYAIPSVIRSKLRELLQEFQLHHYMTTLIESLLILNKNKLSEKNIFINVNNNCFDIILLEENKLLYNNTFQYQTAEDFIYYLLYVLQQLELNPEQISVTLMGEIEKQTPLYDIIYKYIRNINFMKRNESFQYSYVIDKISAHNYFNLFNMSLVH